MHPDHKGSERIADIANKIPVPLAGLMLGLASAGNMVPEYRWAFGALSATVLLFLLYKIFFGTRKLIEELKNPAIAGIFGTFPMGLAVLSTYIHPSFPELAYGIWIGTLVIHIGLIVYFTKQFMFNFELKKCLPCYFVVYVGITIGSVVAPVYDANDIGQVLFWFGFVSYLALLIPLGYRAAVIKGVPEQLLPTVSIFAAPASLCLVGYIKSFPERDMLIVYLLFFLSMASYAVVLALLPRMLRIKFYPSYSAFTFPFVISAIATNLTYTVMKNDGTDIVALEYLAWVEIAIAVFLIAYVIVRYAMHFWPKGTKAT